MKLHEILIGFVVMASIVAGLMMFLSGGTVAYPVADFNSSQYSIIEQGMQNITDIANETSGSLSEIKGTSGFTDILGTFISSSYSSVKIAGKSIDVFANSMSTIIAPLNLGGFGNILIALIGTILILVFIGIFLHVITGSERT